MVLLFTILLKFNVFALDSSVYLDGTSIGSVDPSKAYYLISFGNNPMADYSMNVSSVPKGTTYSLSFPKDLNILSVTAFGTSSIKEVSPNEYRIVSLGISGSVENAFIVTVFNKKGTLLEPKVSISPSSYNMTISIDKLLNDIYSSFEIYVDGKLNSTVPVAGSSSHITGISYKLENLIPNKTYKIRIRGKPPFNGAFEVFDKTYIVKTGDIALDVKQKVTDSSNTITVGDIPDLTGEKFEILFNGKVYDFVDNTCILDNLDSDKDYSFQIRFSLDGSYSEWKDYSFRTLPWSKPPVDSKELRVTSFGTDFIKVKVIGGLGITDYQFYLDDSLVATVQDREFTYLDLEPDTEYKLSVIGSNAHGSSSELSINFKTEPLPPPKVFGLTASMISSDTPMKRMIKWSHEGVLDGFKLLVDDVEIDTFSNSINEHTIDFESLGYVEGDVVKLEVVPLDLGGMGAVLSVDLSNTSIGSDYLDTIIITMLNGLDLMLSSGVLLLLALIPFVILFIAIRILFKKFKVWVSNSSNYGQPFNNKEVVSVKNSSSMDNDISDEDFIKQYNALNSIRGSGVLPEEGYSGLSNGSVVHHNNEYLDAHTGEVLKNYDSNKDDKRTNSLMNEISRLR